MALEDVSAHRGGTDPIEVAAVLVMLEGLNANAKKPGVAMYVAMHSQNAQYKMEQFVAGTNSGIKSLQDFKGKKLLSSDSVDEVLSEYWVALLGHERAWLRRRVTADPAARS